VRLAVAAGAASRYGVVGDELDDAFEVVTLGLTKDQIHESHPRQTCRTAGSPGCIALLTRTIFEFPLLREAHSRDQLPHVRGVEQLP
jgi:hypothetical protein